MTRWKPDAHGRLEEAALALYRERGFDQTTVGEIAARAGVTERTFFRHFADKREVLFAGAEQLRDLLVTGVTEAPSTTTPISAVAGSLAAAAEQMQEHRAWSQQRQAVIDANPELRERESIKLVSLAAALADALRSRGVKEPAASLAAEAGIAVFRIAFERWVEASNRRRLPTIIRDSFRALCAVTADT